MTGAHRDHIGRWGRPARESALDAIGQPSQVALAGLTLGARGATALNATRIEHGRDSPCAGKISSRCDRVSALRDTSGSCAHMSPASGVACQREQAEITENHGTRASRCVAQCRAMQPKPSPSSSMPRAWRGEHQE